MGSMTPAIDEPVDAMPVASDFFEEKYVAITESCKRQNIQAEGKLLY